MRDNEKVKELCRQIYEECGTGAHFNLVFDKTLVIGAVMDIGKFGLSEGTKNNIVGEPYECANMFYNLILFYALHIKEIMQFSSELLAHKIASRLYRDLDVITDKEGMINFKLKPLHQGKIV